MHRCLQPLQPLERLRIPALTAAILVMAGVTSRTYADDAWTTVSGDRGGGKSVHVSLPQPAKRHAQTFTNSNGKGSIVIYKASASPGMFFNVAFINYPDAVVRKMHQDPLPFQERFLQGAMRKKPGSQGGSSRIKVPSGVKSALQYEFSFPAYRDSQGNQGGTGKAGYTGHTVARTYIAGDTLCWVFVDIIEPNSANASVKVPPLVRQNLVRFFKSVAFGKLR